MGFASLGITPIGAWQHCRVAGLVLESLTLHLGYISISASCTCLYGSIGCICNWTLSKCLSVTCISSDIVISILVTICAYCMNRCFRVCLW